MRFPHIYYALLLSLTSAAVSAQDGPIPNTDDIEVLKASVLVWSKSLTSFAGRYTVTQTDGPAVLEPHEPRVFTVDDRFQGKDRYYSLDRPAKGGTRYVSTQALLNGKVTESGIRSVADGRRVTTGVTGRKEEDWFFKSEHLMAPSWLFGKIAEAPAIESLFAIAKIRLARREDYRVIVCTGERERLDILISPSGFVTGFERSWVCSKTMEEAVAKIWPGDLSEFRWLRTSVELGEYRRLNDVWFPIAARAILWQNEPTQMAELVEARKAGKVSEAEFLVKRNTEVPILEWLIEDFALDVENVRINEHLTDGDFTIVFPAEAHVVDVTPRRTWTLPVLLGIAAGLFLGGIAAGIMWLQRQMT